MDRDMHARRRRTGPAWLVLAPALMLLAGCGAPAVGLISPAVSGAPAVADAVGGNRSEGYWVARKPAVEAAVTDAAAAFDLTETSRRDDGDNTIIGYADDAGTPLEARIDPRTRALTFVSFSGPVGLTSLFARQVTEELRAADAYLVDWAGGAAPGGARYQ